MMIPAHTMHLLPRIYTCQPTLIAGLLEKLRTNHKFFSAFERYVIT